MYEEINFVCLKKISHHFKPKFGFLVLSIVMFKKNERKEKITQTFLLYDETVKRQKHNQARQIKPI